MAEMDIGRWSGLTTAEVATRHADEWERLRAGEDLPRGGGELCPVSGRLVSPSSRCLNGIPASKS
jgi:broad specificity phosphatase PhoE